MKTERMYQFDFQELSDKYVKSLKLLELISKKGIISRTEISKTTGINIVSVSNYIKRYIDKTPEKQRRNIRVVTSDKDVYYYARSASATPVSSEDFWDKLRGREDVQSRDQ